jgi:hypothetical protein
MSQIEEIYPLPNQKNGIQRLGNYFGVSTGLLELNLLTLHKILGVVAFACMVLEERGVSTYYTVLGTQKGQETSRLTDFRTMRTP